MSDADKPDWRKHLTPDERKEFRALEREIAKGDKQTKKLRAKRRTIQNRATARGRYGRWCAANESIQNQ
jgi:hypothetical protein